MGGENQSDPEMQRKAHRAVVVLYLVMGAGITLPVLLWLFWR